MKYTDIIPQTIQIGGQTIEIRLDEDIEGGVLGESVVAAGLIKIAKRSKGYEQSDTSKFNTFVHECTHAILDTMGRTDLSQDETFVCSFGGFATELIKSIIDKR